MGNSKIIRYIPVLLALALVAGILIGNSLKRNSQGGIPGIYSSGSGKLNTILELIEHGYVDTVNIPAIVEKTIPEILANLDPHSTYIPASEMQEVTEEMQGNFSGIGVQFSIQEDTVRVVEVISGGPSSKAGILAGDCIVSVGDTLIAGIGIQNDRVMNLLRGPRGSKVNVGILRSGSSSRFDFEIIRDEIPIYSVDVSYMIDDETGFIKVSRFAEKTYQEFMEGVEKLSNSGAKKIIIDLRGNTGGYLVAVIRMLDEFLQKDEPILYTQGLNQAKKTYTATGRSHFADKELYVLIDEYSASASEIFAGAIQDNDRGLVIGRRTFGKGLVQEQIPLSDGSAVRLTVARYYTPSGRCIQKPYSQDSGDYYQDLYKRMNHGEMQVADSIHFDDSLKYKTRSGRIVYGGGGIMPDIFIPADTTGISEYYAKLAQKGIIYRFAYFYTDKNRAALSQLKTASEIDDYLTKNSMLGELLRYAEGKGIPADKNGLRISGDIISTQAKAYIARNVIGEEGFYPIIQKIDNTLLRTIDITRQHLLVENVGKRDSD